jgi:hypothetical protein
LEHSPRKPLAANNRLTRYFLQKVRNTTLREYLTVASGSRPFLFGLEIYVRVKILLVSVSFPDSDKENHRCDTDMTADIRYHG